MLVGRVHTVLRRLRDGWRGHPASKPAVKENVPLSEREVHALGLLWRLGVMRLPLMETGLRINLRRKGLIKEAELLTKVDGKEVPMLYVYLTDEGRARLAQERRREQKEQKLMGTARS